MKSTLKLNNTGSFFNFLMGNNESVPEVGKGGTQLFHSDRRAFEVLEILDGGKRLICEDYVARRVDTLGMSDTQEYEYKEMTGHKYTLVYRHGAWKRRSESMEFEQAFWDAYYHSDRNGYDAFMKPFVDENGLINKLVPGVTKRVVNFQKVNVIFGVKREYFDYSF